MADYVYLLQARLTRAQQAALDAVREVARAHSLTVFLVGGAVRDLTSGAPVRDLDVAVQGNALTLRKDLEARGATVLGTYPVMQTLHLSFPGGVRLGVESTLSVTYPKPGKPVAEPANILDDLRRRDFTVNSMAVSLNEGSYGLLMDPQNGVADLENRELRLNSNYGFIEDPSRMLRGIRLLARLGWQFEEKTRQRYENSKAEGHISALTPQSRGYEIEDIFHEEEPLRVLHRMEEEGWSASLAPTLQSGKANEPELERLRDLVDQFQIMGIFPDASAANFPLLTAKMQPKDIAELKSSFARPGFVQEIEALEAVTKEFANRFAAKGAAPSETWNLLLTTAPEQVLSLAFSSKNAAVQARFKAFFEEWPGARQRIPYAILQEMRITPDLPGYDDLLETMFFALMDGKLETPDAIREFLQPYSPPAPPPPVNLRRRAVKRETKGSRSKNKPAKRATETDDGNEQEDGISAKPASEAVATPPQKPEAPKKDPVVKRVSASEQAPVPAKATAKVTPAKAAPAKPHLQTKGGQAKAAPQAAPKGVKSGKTTAASAKKTVKASTKVKTPQQATKSAAKKTSPKKPVSRQTVKKSAKVPSATKKAPPRKVVAKTMSKKATQPTPKKSAKKGRR